MNALELAKLRASQSEKNRAAMPLVTAIVDEARQYFPDAKIKYATEGGIIVGRPSGEGVSA